MISLISYDFKYHIYFDALLSETRSTHTSEFYR